MTQQKPLTKERAIDDYTELQRRCDIGAYSERSTEDYMNDTWPEDGGEEAIHNLEQWAEKQGVEFCWNRDTSTWSLEPIEAWRQQTVDEARRKQATRDWHTRAIVRIKETITKRAPGSGEHTFRADQEVEMVQWGRAGRDVDRSYWWTSLDIDGAFIVKASEVELVTINSMKRFLQLKSQQIRTKSCVVGGLAYLTVMMYTNGASERLSYAGRSFFYVVRFAARMST